MLGDVALNISRGEEYVQRAAYDAAGEHPMLNAAIILFVLALASAFLGFGGFAASLAGLAKVAFVVFIVLSVVSFLLRGRLP